MSAFEFSSDFDAAVATADEWRAFGARVAANAATIRAGGKDAARAYARAFHEFYAPDHWTLASSDRRRAEIIDRMAGEATRAAAAIGAPWYVDRTPDGYDILMVAHLGHADTGYMHGMTLNPGYLRSAEDMRRLQDFQARLVARRA